MFLPAAHVIIQAEHKNKQNPDLGRQQGLAATYGWVSEGIAARLYRMKRIIALSTQLQAA